MTCHRTACKRHTGSSCGAGINPYGCSQFVVDPTKPRFVYETNCTQCQDVDALQEMIDWGMKVTYRTAAKYIDMEEANIMLGYGDRMSRQLAGLSLRNDYAVSFHKSRFKGQDCYFIKHSAIEYIWVYREGCRG